jgi:hypothetical protein
VCHFEIINRSKNAQELSPKHEKMNAMPNDPLQTTAINFGSACQPTQSGNGSVSFFGKGMYPTILSINNKS